VAYKVTPASIGSGMPRKWKPDPLLDDSETLEPADYKGAHAELGTDRGHQVPLASFAGTEEWHSTNYLSNITPQKSALNQGPWKNLEEAERNMARQDKAVYVMSGPIFGDSDISLPGADEPTELPEAYWKIISVETETGLKTASFLMPQAAGRKDDFCSFIAPLTTISEATGLTFFHAANYAEETHIHIASPAECRSWLK
jgi:endonuclease G